MLTIPLLLVLIALICFGLRVVGVASRVDLIALGLFCWLLSQVLR